MTQLNQRQKGCLENNWLLKTLTRLDGALRGSDKVENLKEIVRLCVDMASSHHQGMFLIRILKDVICPEGENDIC